MSTEVKREINLEKLRNSKLFVAVPMYGGMCHGHFAQSLVNLNTICSKYGLDMLFFSLYNESLIQRARNYLADEFIRSGRSHMMFIDSDIEFNPYDVLALWDMAEPGSDKDVVCATYPKKNISWEKIKSAVDKGHADKNPFALEHFVGDFVFNPVPGVSEIDIQKPVEVLESGTGFMMIQRQAFQKFDKKFPERSYKPDHARSKEFDGTREIMNYFPVEVDPVSKRLLSEDYMFCQMIREAGGKIWICPWMNLVHHGSYPFTGNLGAIAAIGESATSDMNKVKGLKT